MKANRIMKANKLFASLVSALFALTIAAVSLAAEFDPPGLARAIEVQDRDTPGLMLREGVVGTAIGIAFDGEVVIRIFVDGPERRGIPDALDGVPVVVQVTGKIDALHHRRGHRGGPGDGGGNKEIDPTSRFKRPVPIGVSTGNEGECSSGTIGARLTDGVNVFALSNNHVYALKNNAALGSRILQPGRFDTKNCGIRDRNAIGVLWDFVRIDFRPGTTNVVDAAIARSTTADLRRTTPSDGYGAPRSSTAAAFIDQAVQKYGRTTSLTTGFVTGINATISVNFFPEFAVFVDQIIVESPQAFILPGDSGSLLVEQGSRVTVGLLFAGTKAGTLAIANPIDEVLAAFDLSIDGF